MLSLYLKTHKVTGLKYLGKTEKDPFVYQGSGVRWKNHLKKHGDFVDTEVLFQTNDDKEFTKVALEYSNKYDIVNSPEFANLMEEQGQGGRNSGSFKKGQTPWNKGVPAPGVEKRLELWRKENHPTIIGKGKVLRHKDNIVKDYSKLKQMNTGKETCPHCGIQTNLGNLNRWHGDRCKAKQ